LEPFSLLAITPAGAFGKYNCEKIFRSGKFKNSTSLEKLLHGYILEIL
jgi:hypothetical protein